jgi:biopolymer transport protein ExbD
MSTLASSLFSTAAGILVAVPANCFYNYLRTRIDLLESKEFTGLHADGSRCGRIVEILPLTKRFSDLPAFPLIAAPGLSMLVAVSMLFSSYGVPKGLEVQLPSNRCESDADQRVIVLRVTNAGGVFLNEEHQDWNTLGDRLSAIYSMRAHRVLFFVADDNVSFQTVADAIDIARNARYNGKSLDSKVALLARKVINVRCPEVEVL